MLRHRTPKKRLISSYNIFDAEFLLKLLQEKKLTIYSKQNPACMCF